MKPRSAPRESEVRARLAAIAAADMVIGAPTLAQEDAATAAGAKLGTVQEALMVLRLGTAEQIEAARSGSVAMRPIVDVLRQQAKGDSTPVRPQAFSKDTEERRGAEARVWQHLSVALEELTSLPNPADVVAIVRKHRMRVDATNRKLIDALNWITEFSDAWTS